MKLLDLSKAHLYNNCMSYTQHFTFSFSLSILLFNSSIRAFTHAMIPCFYPTSTSDVIRDIGVLLKNSGCNDKRN